MTPQRHALSMLATIGIVAGCLVGPGGYDGTAGVGYVGGYYAPGGYDYGGWGHGYRVAPPRGGPPEGHGGRGAPARGDAPVGHGGRAAPSIPSRSRGH